MTQPQAFRASPLNRDRHIKASRFAIIAWLIMSLPWIGYFAYAGDHYRLGLLVLSVINQLLALRFFYIGRHYLARVYWLSTQVAAFSLSALFFGQEGNSDLILLFLLGLPVLFFSWHRERKTLILFVAMIFVLAVLAFAVESFGLHRYLFSFPVAPIASEAAHSFGLKLTLAVLITAQFTYFGWITERASDAAETALMTSDAAARAKGEFLANMSHEIRTPMNGLVGMIEILETTPLSDQQNRIIGTIRTSAFSLLRIIDDILDASKVEAGKLDLKTSKTELVPLVEGVAQTLQNTADELDVRIRMLVEPSLPEWIVADAGRLRQVLLNLLSNGVKYSARHLTDRQGEVQFLVAQGPQGGLRFRFGDNGIGMSEDFLAKLFEPFTQAETTSNKQVGGTGLGLAITRSLVELMGGTITVDSVPDKGTVITVDIPLEPAEGPSRKPDLAGLDLICFDLLDEAAREGMERLLSSAGARATFIREVQDLERLQQEGRITETPIVLLPTVSDAQSLSLKNAVRALVPRARILRFSSTRSARYGLQSDDCYLIQIFPMMTSELLRAIAVLGGRGDGPPLDPPEGAPAVSYGEKTISQNIDDPKNAMILVAEDNEINQIVLSSQLDILGYPHEITPNGREALTKWQSGDFDLVLTDCHMPLMDGFELTRKIRRQEAESGAERTPIIAITANALASEAEKCLATGMDGYLAKPVELTALKKKLAEILA